MHQSRSAFTLVELMIVVAIIGILASIALPNMLAMQLRAKRAEIPMNVKAIQSAELAYEATADRFLAQTDPVPRADSALDKQQVPWVNGTNFDMLGWRPSGSVRGNYAVETFDSGGSADPDSVQLIVTGKGDIDADSAYAIYTASNLHEVRLTTGNDLF